MTNKLTVEQVDRDAICEDVLASIPKYLHKAIFTSLARHRQQAEARAEGLVTAALALAISAGKLNVALDRDFGRRSDEMPALNNPDGPQAATLIKQQAQRIVELEGALRQAIALSEAYAHGTGNLYENGIAAARDALGETSSAEGRG